MFQHIVLLNVKRKIICSGSGPETRQGIPWRRDLLSAENQHSTNKTERNQSWRLKERSPSDLLGASQIDYDKPPSAFNMLRHCGGLKKCVKSQHQEGSKGQQVWQEMTGIITMFVKSSVVWRASFVTTNCDLQP